MLTALIINILVSLLGWFFTHRAAADAVRLGEENARSLMAAHLELGHVTAAEKRRQLAQARHTPKPPTMEGHLT